MLSDDLEGRGGGGQEGGDTCIHIADFVVQQKQ